MALLLSVDALRGRASVARAELFPLASGLAAELEPLYGREPYLPSEKALLSRQGGRCERDGATLEFDPFSPHRHRCPICGTLYSGVFHDRFWIFWYQLWLAERAVHGAVLATLLDDTRAGALAASILERYADEYLKYPNRDNVLGPTRLFFSTYLESIWLLNVSIAVDLLEGASSAAVALGAKVRERIIEPSAAIIAQYDEGASNRQVWNDAALIAAGRLLDRTDAVERATFGRSGVIYHLEHGLLADGTWFEGENYHLFAHRGLWYSLAMIAALGWSLPAPLAARFQEGYATPFLTSLPDMTLPSRRDSQYAISLRQPRFAELCELGLAREEGEGDPRLRGVLRRLYEDDVPRGDTGRSRTTADVERNLAGTRLSRADLGWRSLLFARPRLPSLDAQALGSVLLDKQGIAVFRRENQRVYIALDYGASGGGHGHPDRLNVLLSHGTSRWLDDMGTGSYVDPSLHWYRSTLAHNAPLFDGYEQQRVDGELLAYDERDETGWVSAVVGEIAPGVRARRSLIVMPDYVLDELVWWADQPAVMDLPIHVDGAVATRGRAAATDKRLDLDGELVDTLGVLRDVTLAWLGRRSVARISARDGEHMLQGYVMPSERALIYRAVAPGAPGAKARPMLLLRMLSLGTPQRVAIVWSWCDAVADLTPDRRGGRAIVQRRDGAIDRHQQTATGWRVDRTAGDEHFSIDLGGMAKRSRPTAAHPSAYAPRSAHPIRQGAALVFELGATQYRRSEESWEETDRPTAGVSVLLQPNELVIDIAVRKKGPLTFVPAYASNPLDNEAPDINGDGVQLYFADETSATGWVLVPNDQNIDSTAVRVRVIEGWDSPRDLAAVARRTIDGYAMQVRVSWAADSAGSEFGLGVVINEKPPARDRRRGQLVLGAAPGEFVYLRGDREDRDRLPRFRVVN